ncbi:MAG: class I SAM-dependent methyltransferase [Anaerolineaceae bacterium]|nr:class I SAM-dependent methyltransferase [Anaerolineaceae bacterium]
MLKDQMDEIYGSTSPDNIPWSFTSPPKLLTGLVKAIVPKRGSIIELGCGIGNYLIHFAKQGLPACGVDISEKAIKVAKNTALKENVDCKFYVADVLENLSMINDKFDFAYDWELLHHIFPENREKYIRNFYALLKPNASYLSVSFSEESAQFGGIGKFRETPLGTTLYFSNESEIKKLFKEYFVIQDLKTIDIMGKHVLHKAIYALMTKKTSQ